ncbi:unnamed protein product [Calicophoron daubneyi]|uniref:BZIP domain-containing protein n=1 Tax=Calicophoron daubneyi TaxID=300641 RepID=A0AAV2TA01_CALDB
MNQSANLIVDSYVPGLTSFSSAEYSSHRAPVIPMNQTLFCPGDYSCNTNSQRICLADFLTAPNIANLDHQETVHTAASSLPTTVGENSDITGGFPESGTEQSERLYSPWDTSQLFSFELETNGIPDFLAEQPTEIPSDLTWSDLLSNLNDPITANDSEQTPVKTTIETLQLSPEFGKSTSCSASPPSPSSFLSKSSEMGDSDMSPKQKLPRSGRKSRLNVNDDNDEDLELVPIIKSPKFSPKRISGYLNNEDLALGRPGERLVLSAEERKMLSSMGYKMPTRFPLTRTEEKALRTVRRKIRNKLSAQASRLRRQEYIADLEQRIEVSDKENYRLRCQVARLENDKRDLLSHVRRLRSYVAKFLNRTDDLAPLPLFVRTNSKSKTRSTSQAATAAAGGTSLLVITFMILAWTALVPLPSFSLFKATTSIASVYKKPTITVFPGRSRSLLENNVPPEQNSADLAKSEEMVSTNVDAVVPVPGSASKASVSNNSSKSQVIYIKYFGELANKR